MDGTKYIGMDVHKESVSIAVMNSAGKVVMESVIGTKASMILQFVDGLRGDLLVTFEEGTWAAWLYDLLRPHVTRIVVCNPRRNALLKDGNKSDRIDAQKLAELLYLNKLKPVYHGEHGLRAVKELVRSYSTVTKDLTRGLQGVHSHRRHDARANIALLSAIERKTGTLAQIAKIRQYRNGALFEYGESRKRSPAESDIGCCAVSVADLEDQLCHSFHNASSRCKRAPSTRRRSGRSGS